MKHYDLTGAMVIEAMDTPWIYCNDNLTIEEKQMFVDDWHEWMDEVLSIIKKDNNIIYLADYMEVVK